MSAIGSRLLAERLSPLLLSIISVGDVIDIFAEWQLELPLQMPFSFSDDFDCLKCGACCVEAGYVTVYPDEVVPAETRPLRERHADRYPGLKMRELDRHCEGRCKALTGVVGKNPACGIYAHRPRTCREFLPGSEGCQSARIEADSLIHSRRWERRGYGDSWGNHDAIMS